MCGGCRHIQAIQRGAAANWGVHLPPSSGKLMATFAANANKKDEGTGG
jgi:hypothetical protein